MDLPLYVQVLWRFRALVLAGIVLAVGLSLLSLFTVTFHGGLHIRYRQQQAWKSTETLLVSQAGFPWGRASLSTERNGQTVEFAADPSRFSDLAVFYSHLANGDPVRLRVAQGGPLGGAYSYQVDPVVDSSGATTSTLPIFAITGRGPSPEAAVGLTRRVAGAFRAYIAGQQVAARIPPAQRVTITTVSSPDSPSVIGRKLTFPIVVFAAVLIATVVLAFVLENIRQLRGTDPRVRDAVSHAQYLAGSLTNGDQGVLAPADQSAGGAPAPTVETREALEAVALELRAALERASSTGSGDGYGGQKTGTLRPSPRSSEAGSSQQ